MTDTDTNNLPEGFIVKEQPDGARAWMRDGHMFVLAHPYPIKGQPQSGWEVDLISTFGAAHATIKFDELEPLAVWHCRNAVALLDVAVHA